MDMLSAVFILVSNQHRLPPGLLASVCYIESNHNINAIHRHDGRGDSLGVCQIKIIAARQVGFNGTPKQLMEPVANVYYAAKYLKYQQKRYGSIKRGVIAYNLGNAKGLTTTVYQRKVYNKWRITWN